MLRAQRAGIARGVFEVVSVVAALLAPSAALAQSRPSAEPIELAPIRVGPGAAVTEIRVEEPIVVEAVAPTDARRESDGRAVNNPFGTSSQPAAVEPANGAAQSTTSSTNANLARSAAQPTTAASHRCAPSQRAYFDERSQLYRPCVDNSGPPSRTSNVPRGGARSWRAEAVAHCRAGGQSYFDERDQLYRPCPVLPAPNNRASGAARSPDARYAAPAGASARCAPGVRVYFDQREGLFRPCPAP